MTIQISQFYVICLLLVFTGIVTYASEQTTITITSGLADYQVFQRNEDNNANITFSGIYNNNNIDKGVVLARVIDKRTLLNGIQWQKVGSCLNGKLQGELKKVPVGGPYRIELRLSDDDNNINASIAVENILIGDLWVLAGQSNMEGVGKLEATESPSIWVNSFGFNEKWSIASDPLHWLIDSIDPVHHPGIEGEALEREREKQRRERVVGAGCGLSFAKELVKETDVPIGLVPCDHGGTSMEQWDPAKRDEGGNSLYGSMYRRFLAVGGKVKGILWYQGESDAVLDAAPLFHDRFTDFVKAVRKDFNAPDLPFYFVQIGRYITDHPFPQWDTIQEQQRLCAQEIVNCRMVSSIDLTLDDPIHIGTQGHKRLGKRLALVVLKDLFIRTELEAGPELKYIIPIPDHSERYRLHFKGINGAFRDTCRPDGFSIRDTQGNDLFLLYKTMISEDGKTIDLFLSKQPPQDTCLWYGFGLDPHCNIVDNKDMALPAFGPLSINEAIYPAFLVTIRNEPNSRSLPLMLPHVIHFIEKSEKRELEFYSVMKNEMNTLSPDVRLILYPLFFKIGDFSKWGEWIENVSKLPLSKRKHVALSFYSVKDSPHLKADYIKKWHIVGPFDNAQCQGFDRIYEPEKDPDAKSFVNLKGETIRWKSIQADDNGILDFKKVFNYEHVAAYAKAIVDAKNDVQVPILFGSDDAPVVWVNGKEIHREHIHRPLSASSDLVFAQLTKGRNIILIKVCQRTGDWGLCMRLLDKDKILLYECTRS